MIFDLKQLQYFKLKKYGITIYAISESCNEIKNPVGYINALCNNSAL